MERLGYDIVSLNIGNPYAFGFRTPETMRLAMIENLRNSEGYVHQKGIFPAREAVVMQQQERGVRGRHGRRGVHRQRRERADRSDAARAAESRRRGVGAEPGLSAVDRRGEFEHRPRGALSLPAASAASCRTRRTSRRWSRARTRAIVIVNPNNPDRRGVSARDLTAIARIGREASLGGAVR